jgi:hypothetical protein
MSRLMQWAGLTLAIALVVSLSTGSALAADKKKKESKKPTPEREWVKLGEREVSHSLDKIDIDVTSNTTYRSVRIYAEGQKIHVERMVLRFGNDDKQEIKIEEDVDAGEKTKSIDLEGHSRSIKKVSIYCRTIGDDSKNGRVAVWALQG